MSSATNLWRRKLEFLQKEDAISADPALKFRLQKEIEEAKARIAELEAEVQANVPQAGLSVFLSWSGTQSRYLAELLRDWVPSVIQQVTPWLSAQDIVPGTRWSENLAGELEKSNVGIICLTPDNITSPWLFFEAGALSKALDTARVIPLLYDLEFSDVPAPLAQFQCVRADRDGMRALITAINSFCNEPLPEARLAQAIDMWWPRLAERLSDVPVELTQELKRGTAIELTLTGELDDFDVRKEAQLLEDVRRFLSARYRIRVIEKSAGSVIISLEVEFEDAIKLLEAYNDGALPLQNVLSVSIKSERRTDELSPAEAKKAFDVFLCHNSSDKPAVRELADQLRERGLSVWLDEEQLRPGMPWQVALEKQIGTIKAAAVCIGESGVGPWQQLEMRAFLSELLRRNAPVIPVILSSAGDATPELPIFLRQVTWVDLRRDSPDPYKQLAYGITGEKA